jgi:flagellin-like hook-associated protein FlgL
MSIKINSNISSLTAQRYLSNASDSINNTMSRLSSGLRINKAADDAAGLAIASSLKSDSRVFSQAIRNISDGVSMLSIAQGALEQLSAISTRQLELAEQAANGTYTLKQRESMHDEANALVAEWNRITQSTKFNGVSIFDQNNRSLRIQAGYQLDGSLALAFNDELSRAIGTGSFSESQTFTTASTAGRAALADFNGDGKVDMITAQDGIRLGNGDGTFGAASAVSAVAGQSSYYTSDLNNDGKADLITASATGFRIALGNGNGTFGTAQNFSISGPSGFSFADFNNDGALDIVVSEYNSGTGNNVHIFTNNGNGGFSSTANILTSDTGPISVTTADFNGDGIQDIAVSSRTNSTVGFRFGNGNGTFSAQTTTGISGLAGFTGIVGTDFNNDGYDDIVIAGSSGIRILISNGNGTFQTAINPSISGASFSSSPSVGDINGDGFTDVAVADSGANIIYSVLSNGDGTFRIGGSFNTASMPTPIQNPILADLNNDNVLDIVTGTNAGNHIFVGLSQTQDTTTIGQLNLMTQQKARAMLGQIRDNLDRVVGELGKLGSHQSRLEVASNHLRITNENSISAMSRIMDADVAEEAATFARQQILQQAASSILAQTNIQPQLALSLLRG